MANYMAIDQYGHMVSKLVFPRKDLMAYYDTQHAEKLYFDKKHVGYIVKGRKCVVYKVTRMDEI